MQNKLSLLFLFLCGFQSLVLAQKSPKLSEFLPLDSQIVHKTLPNGLSYYILKNAKPANNCQIRLLVKAGSLQEENNEQGVAHFVEHMAFNGTKNFPKRKIVEELELMGNKFGADINASTSFDRTIYMLEVPSNTNEKIDKGLQIISDWAFNISFDAEEVEKEKGVVLAERRGRKSASEQYQKQMAAFTMNNARHTERYPIGDSLMIFNATPALLQNFYRTWYRPNLMSVIVVGDFENTKEIEEKIIALFGKAQNPTPEKTHLSYSVPPSDGFKTLILKDKEKTSFVLDYHNRQTFKSDSSLREFRETQIFSLTNSLINRYLYEENQKSKPPFLQCSFYPSFVDKTQMDMVFKVVLREQDIASGIKAMFVERKKLMQYQFPKEQLEQIRFNYLKSYDNALQEFSNTTNEVWVSAFLNSAFEKTPIYDSKKTVLFIKKILSEISIEEVNQQVQKILAPQKNGFMMYYGMDKEGVQTPTDSLLKNIMQQVDNETVGNIVDVKSDKKLLSKIPTPVSFSKKTNKQLTQGNAENPSLFLTEYDYKNGAKVVVLPTKFKEDEVLFSAYSEGGHGKASFENRFNASFAARIIGSSGLSDMTPTEFRNLSFGKFSSVSPSISESKERIGGSFVTKDADFFFQNLYATFLFPRKDEAVFEKFIVSQKQNIANRKLQPTVAFYDTLSALKSNFNPRAKGMTLEDVERLNVDKMLDFYKERFQNGGDFTYFFVGNTDLIPNFEEYLNTYIGSLSPQKDKDKSVYFDYKTPEGKYEIVKADATEPQNKVEIYLSGKQKYNRKNRQQLEMLTNILENRLLIELREEKGAVYGVSCYGNIDSDNRYTISINFGCEPNKEAELIEATYKVFEKIKTEGATVEELQKIVENRKKTTAEKRKDNGSLLSTLTYFYEGKQNLDFFKTEDTANKNYYDIKPMDFSTLAKKYLNRKNEILSILKTKKKLGA